MNEKKLRTLPLFKRCSDSFITRILADSNTRNYNKGHVLFLHEDKAERFYLIEKGWVKLFRETLEGTQAVIDIHTKDRIFGITSIFEQGIYPYSAEIIDDASLTSFPIEPFKKELKNNSKLAYDLLQLMTHNRRLQEKEIEHRSLQNASQRIGCFILRLALQNKQNINTHKIRLPYDKMLVASRLGMQPETFSRALNKLKDQTNIRIKGSIIEIDEIESLSHYACTACSSEFPCKDLTTKH